MAVVVLPESELAAGVSLAKEELHIPAFVSQSAVEALDVADSDRHGRMKSRYTVGEGPQVQHLPGEFLAVVHDEHRTRRFAATVPFMKVPKPRSRILSVRLSEEEFAALGRICSITGARSVSGLARDAMRVLLSGANLGGEFDTHLDDFRVQIKNLDKKIDQLAARISTSNTGDEV